MRDFLAHHYFATNPEIIQLTIDKRLPLLSDAVSRILTRLNTTEGSAASGPNPPTNAN